MLHLYTHTMVVQQACSRPQCREHADSALRGDVRTATAPRVGGPTLQQKHTRVLHTSPASRSTPPTSSSEAAALAQGRHRRPLASVWERRPRLQRLGRAVVASRPPWWPPRESSCPQSWSGSKLRPGGTSGAAAPRRKGQDGGYAALFLFWARGSAAESLRAEGGFALFISGITGSLPESLWLLPRVQKMFGKGQVAGLLPCGLSWNSTLVLER